MPAPREIEYLPIDSLVPALRNPKGHDLQSLSVSVEEFGWLEPQFLDERTGRLVAGHGRLEYLVANRDAGQEPPEGIVVAKDGTWLAPVVRGWSSRNDDHAHAAGVALNRLTEIGDWKRPELADLLAELQEVDLLAATGFSDHELADLMASLHPPALGDLEDDLGEPDPRDFWPVLRFRVSPATRTRFLNLVADVPGDDTAHFEWLLDVAKP